MHEPQTSPVRHRPPATAQHGVGGASPDGGRTPVVAIRDALATAEPPHVVEVLARHGPMLLAHAREDLVDEALAALPADVVDQDLDVVAVRAMRHRVCGPVEEVVHGAARFGELDRFPAAPAVAGGPRRQADRLLLALWQARFGLRPADEATAAAEALLTAVADGEQLCAARRCWLSFELGAVHLWLGDTARALLWTERGSTVAELSRAPRLRAAALAHRSVIEVIDGSYAAAAASARQSLREAAASQLLGDAYLVRAEAAAAWVAYERLDVDAAWDHLAAVERVSAHELDPVVRTLAHATRGRLLTLHGEHEHAWTWLSSGPLRRGDLPPALGRLLTVARAEVAVGRRDPTAVEREADTFERMGQPDDAALFHGVAALLAGRPGDARVRLQRVLDHPTAHAATGAAAAACLVAMTLLAKGADAARPLVPDLLARVATSASDIVLLIGSVAGDGFTTLLEQEAARGPDGHPYAVRALRRLRQFHERSHGSAGEAVPRPGRPTAQHDGAPALAQQDGAPLLTQRETAVLACLRDGMSYEQIGRALFITPNTVKTHVRALHRKLAVERSSQAVRRAQELGLLPRA